MLQRGKLTPGTLIIRLSWTTIVSPYKPIDTLGYPTQRYRAMGKHKPVKIAPYTEYGKP